MPPDSGVPKLKGDDGSVTTQLTDIGVALEAAAAGARVVKDYYGGSLIRQAKGGLDFATNADIDAERAILDVIADARPDDARIGEESGATDGATQRSWLVDPLCGTLNFAAQTPLVAVNVALVDGDKTLACVSADPISGEIFWGDQHQAFLRRNGADEPLRPNAMSRLVDINCDGPRDQKFFGPQLIGDADFRSEFGPRVLSTTLTLAWVAAGRRAAYVTDGSFVDNVHFVAGIGLGRAAGCVVTDLAGDPLNTGRGLIVAADRDVHEQLVGLIAPYLAELAK